MCVSKHDLEINPRGEVKWIYQKKFAKTNRKFNLIQKHK